MTNRERLLTTSEYDTLVKMNEYVLTCGCCIVDVLNQKETFDCGEYKGDCKKCIADWLNEEVE